MCSCSGNCNCNSSTIPRGPQGPQGPAATITVGNVTALPSGDAPTVTNTGTSGAATFNFGIPAGAPGTNGATGNPGVNAYTTLTAPFLQPNINSTIVISVVNSSWVAIDQIIFIGPTTFINAGGYYRVINIPTLTSIEIIRLDWTIPGITFRAFNTIVGATGTLVTTSGTIGATDNQIAVLGFDGDIRLTSISTPGGYQNTSSFTIPANANTSINDWI